MSRTPLWCAAASWHEIPHHVLQDVRERSGYGLSSGGLLAECLNCGSGGVQGYCPRCGQERADDIPSVREWLASVREDLVTVDRRLLRTFMGCSFRAG